MDGEEQERPRSRGGELAICGAQLLGLSGLAFAEPLYDLFQGDLSSLVSTDATGLALVLLIAGIALVPPLVLFSLEAIASAIGAGAGRALHVVFVGGLIALFVLQAHASIDVPGSVLILAALVLGVGGALLYPRSRAFRLGLNVLAPAPLLFAALFLVSPAVSPLLHAHEPRVRAVPSASAAPLVLLVFDELPVTSLLDWRGRIDGGRYPAFARLARDGTWFPNTTSVDGATPWAVPAILTGDYPDPDALATSSAHPRSIFTLMGGERDAHVLEPITRVCPASLCRRDEESAPTRALGAANLLSNASANRLLPDPLSRGALKVARGVQILVGADASGDYLAARVRERVGAFNRIVDSIHSGGRSDLYVVHLLLPHGPWEFLPSGRRYTAALDGLIDGRWSADPDLVTQGWQRHLLQLEYTDRLLGKLLDRLDEQGLYDEALVAVVADHGVNFAPQQPRRELDARSVHQLAPVPFILKAPGRRGGKIDPEPLQTIDVLPTIADALGAELPWHSDGTSAFSRERVHPTTARVTESGVDPTEVARTQLGRDGAAAARRQALFGSGRDRRALYAPGTMSRLVGRRVPNGLRSSRSAQVHVGGSAEAMPAYVQGTVDGVPVNRELAFAVGGRIAAVTRSYGLDGETVFATPLPDWALRPRAGRLAVLALDQDGALARLPRAR